MQSVEHGPPSCDLVHSWMGLEHLSNSYERPNYPVGDLFGQGNGEQVPGPSPFRKSGGMGWEQHDPVGSLVDQSDSGQIAGPSTLGAFGGMGWEEHSPVGN